MKRIAIASFRRDPAGSAFCYRQDIANEAYTDAILKSGALPLIIPQLAPSYAEEALRGFSALLIPGGHDIDPSLYGEDPTYATAYDKTEDLYQIALLKAAIRSRIPVLGICRGMQLINVALGGTLFQDIGKEFSQCICHRAVSTPYSGAHRITIQMDSVLHSILNADSIMVNSLHHQGIKALGDGLRTSASADDGIIEAFEGDRIYGVQWHPEAMYREMESLFRYFVSEADDV